MEGREPIGVTLLSGFLGAGKTTLMRNLLQDNQGKERIAVIVNDMAELNIDAKLVRSVQQVEEKMVQMENGCICCTLREDLLVELKKLAEAKEFDYILIESTGISEPQQVAETFAFEDDNGVALNEWTKLDTLVTVVDCVNFENVMKSEQTVQDTGEGVDEEDERSLSALLIDQIEFSNVILLNKCDLADKETVDAVNGQITAMNPDATVFRTVKSKLPSSSVLHTGKFDLQAAEMNPGWMKVLRGEPMRPETEEYGVSSFIYRRRKPFHPQRFADLLEKSEPLPRIIRSKGTAWLASHNHIMLEWSSAGKLYEIEAATNWFICKKREDWPDYLDAETIMKDFDGDNGDRRQEIVLIGHGMNQEEVTKILDDALMQEGEEWPEEWPEDLENPWDYLDAQDDDEDEDEDEDEDDDEVEE